MNSYTYEFVYEMIINLHVDIFYINSLNYSSSGKATPWASQDNPGYPSIGFVDWDNPG